MAWPRRRPQARLTTFQTRCAGRPVYPTWPGGLRSDGWVPPPCGLDHVRPERRYFPPGDPGFRKRAMRRVRKSTAQGYCQLLSGHAAIGSFLHDRMTGPQRLDSDECWWCGCGRRQTRHHLFTGCRAWTPKIRELWQRVGKDCGWEHPRAPAPRWLWEDDAVGAVVNFLESTRVGSRASAGMARARVDEVRGEEGEEGGPGPH